MNPPKKQSRSLIFSTEFKRSIREAVQAAVMESESFGLAPSYEPAYSKLQEFRRKQTKARDEIIKTHLLTYLEEAYNDTAILEFHRNIAELLEEGGQPGLFIIRKACETIDDWERNAVNTRHIRAWKRILQQPITGIREYILSNDATGQTLSLRASSPFVHLSIYPADEWVDGIAVLEVK